MARGLAYDSGRRSRLGQRDHRLMTGHGYRTSALVAEAMGPFEGYRPTPTRCSA